MRFISALLLGLALIAAPSTAEAANKTPGCVTKKEFRRIGGGMTADQVRAIVGHGGRVVSSASFADGDAFMGLKFKQCGQSWKVSSVHVDFEYTETTVYVPDVQCFGSDCYDFGSNETRYSPPFIVTSKYAFWF